MWKAKTKTKKLAYLKVEVDVDSFRSSGESYGVATSSTT